MTHTDERRPVGRPSEYDPAYCQRVVELGKEGYSRAEIASELGCSRTTLTAWEGAHPEFLAAVHRAKDESLAWWEKQSRKNLSNKNFNSPLWSKAVSGRFPEEPYRERVQVTGRNDGPIQHVDLSKVSDADLDRLETILGGADAGRDPSGEGEAGS